ncbi:MAG: hypothetical protein ACHQF4_04545 [Sphingobacteriales bacterium]
MKKKSTVVNQPGKTEANKPEVLMPQNHIKSNHLPQSLWDHSHGRSKFPFGSDRGPLAF